MIVKLCPTNFCLILFWLDSLYVLDDRLARREFTRVSSAGVTTAGLCVGIERLVWYVSVPGSQLHLPSSARAGSRPLTRGPGSCLKVRLKQCIKLENICIAFIINCLMLVIDSAAMVNTSFYWNGLCCRGIEFRPEFACLWKLAGDCLTMGGTLPRAWQFLEVPLNLLPKSQDKQTLQGSQLLQLGVRYDSYKNIINKLKYYY